MHRLSTSVTDSTGQEEAAAAASWVRSSQRRFHKDGANGRPLIFFIAPPEKCLRSSSAAAARWGRALNAPVPTEIGDAGLRQTSSAFQSSILFRRNRCASDPPTSSPWASPGKRLTQRMSSTGVGIIHHTKDTDPSMGETGNVDGLIQCRKIVHIPSGSSGRKIVPVIGHAHSDILLTSYSCRPSGAFVCSSVCQLRQLSAFAHFGEGNASSTPTKSSRIPSGSFTVRGTQ